MTEIPACSRCGSERVAEIVYGLVGGSEIMQAINEGRIILGSCVVSQNDPK